MNCGTYIALNETTSEATENRCVLKMHLPDDGSTPEWSSAALIHEVKPAGQVLRDIVAEARAVFEGW